MQTSNKSNKINGPKNVSNPGLAIVVFLTSVFLTFVAFKQSRDIILWIFAFLSFCSISLRLFFIILSLKTQKQSNKIINIDNFNDSIELKTFTLLIPVYKEKYTVLHQLVKSILQINYPKEKMDVKIILEQDDNQTIQNVKLVLQEVQSVMDASTKLDFELVVVPHSLPKTKPKACNYAMEFAKGDYIGIYDAEDIPHKDQLLAVNKAFNDDNSIVCVQCPLLFYNAKQNFLTRFFQMEYFVWFKLTLPQMCKLKMPIALGGTSNFIKKAELEELCLWSAYNVTEDAELGMRFFVFNNTKGKFNNKLNTAFVDLCTMEECPCNLQNWLNQRSRWIKGFNQSYFFHFANVLKLKCGVFQKLTFFIMYGSSSIGFLLNILFILLWILSLLFNFSVSNILNFAFGVNFAILFFVLYLSWYECLKFESPKPKFLIVKSLFFALLSPFYFLLHSIASIIAIFEIIKNPFHWRKTTHNGKVESR